MNENREYCKRVADELEAYAAGRMWRDIETGEEKEMDFDAANDDDEQLSVSDYLADALDYEITIDSQMEYKSAKIWVTLGGPTVWVDTADRAVKLAWGTDREEYPLDWDTSAHLDEVLEDEYNARRGC